MPVPPINSVAIGARRNRRLLYTGSNQYYQMISHSDTL